MPREYKKPIRLRDRLNKSTYPTPRQQPEAANVSLWIEDQQYQVLDMEYGFMHHTDGAGRTVGGCHLKPFTVVIRPVGTMDLVMQLLWSDEMLFSGRIEHFHLDGINKVCRDTIIHNAYIARYETYGNYFESQQGRVAVLTIAPQYLKINDTIYETKKNPSRPMEMNPKGILSRESFED